MYLLYDPFDPFGVGGFFELILISTILMIVIPIIVIVIVIIVIFWYLNKSGGSDNKVIKSPGYDRDRQETRPSRYARQPSTSTPQERISKPSQPAPGSGFCPNCGAAVTKDDAFCISCGRYLSN